MFNYIKEAAKAVVTKNENLQRIEEANTTLELLNRKIEQAKQTLGEIDKRDKKLAHNIKGKEEDLLQLQKEESRKQVEKWNLENNIENLKKKYLESVQHNQKLEKEIQQKEVSIRNLNAELLYLQDLEDPKLKRMKSVAHLCSALKQTAEKKGEYDWSMDVDVDRECKYSYPYLINLDLLSQRRSIQPRGDDQKAESIHLMSESFLLKKYPKPIRDQVVDDLMYRFIENEEMICIAYPGALAAIIQSIKKKDTSRPTILLSNRYYSSIRGLFLDNINRISTFFKVLMQKGYPVEGNESFYLELLKEKALDNNFADLEDSFFTLFTLYPEFSSISDVIQLYIQLLDGLESNLYETNRLLFLNMFLYKKGFRESLYLVEDLEKLVRAEVEQYKVMKLERQLSNAKKVFIKDISFKHAEKMSKEDFESSLVELLIRLGFSAQVTGDQGVDIIANKQGKTYAIQAKRLAGTVSNKAIQEVVSGKEYYNANVSWIITNTDFSPSAIDLASKTNTLLWEGKQIKSLIDLANL